MIIQRKSYYKFGAKTEMAYGNSMVTKYMYDPVNLRLDSLVSSLQSNPYFSMGYEYDAKGNVVKLYSKYSCFNGNNPITQTFEYDSTDQLTNAQGTYYTTAITYGNTGKIATYSATGNSGGTFYYPDIQNQTSTIFAPDSSNDGGRTTYYDFGINGSLRRKWFYEGDEINRMERGEYYWFNAFNCMKAYSDNAEQYAYYGYDASGERTYKININPEIFNINAEEILMTYHADRYMLYPNGYMNVNQAGEYTKHYYADALRIASKIGGTYENDFCDSVAQIETDYPNYLTSRSNEQESVMREELDSVTKYDIITSTISFGAPNQCSLHGGIGEENAVFYYHPDHLGSTGMVTDNNANITQGFLYAPFGEIVNEYNPGFGDNIPKYAFNAKEFDEENGMYYYSARYYAPPTFISRDPMFEKYPSISPYTYCANNPMKLVDPTGQTLEEIEGGGKPPKGLIPGLIPQQNFSLYKSPEAAKKAQVKTASPKTTVTNTATSQSNNQQQSSSSSSRTRADLPTTTETFTGTGIASKVVEGVANNSAAGATKGEAAAAQTFKNVSKGAKVFGTVLGAGSMFYNGYQGYKATTFEKKVEYYTDAVMDGVGLIPGLWAVPIVWNCGGKQVYQKWQTDVLMPQIEIGIEGSAASQPFK